ncbi:hypothetical protein B0H14DRAFT_3776386 [Mycena olivaceomarginata]|nr:hypothetical protein B0H14DRAFT_3776386 [Mycena olivaceomarginata]
MLEKRAVDAHNGLKENGWRAVWRGDRERALDGRKSWWKPRNVTLVTSGNAAEGKLAFGNLRPALATNSEEVEFFQTINHTRGGPNWHAHTKKSLNNHQLGDTSVDIQRRAYSSGVYGIDGEDLEQREKQKKRSEEDDGEQVWGEKQARCGIREEVRRMCSVQRRGQGHYSKMHASTQVSDSKCEEWISRSPGGESSAQAAGIERTWIAVSRHADSGRIVHGWREASARAARNEHGDRAWEWRATSARAERTGDDHRAPMVQVSRARARARAARNEGAWGRESRTGGDHRVCMVQVSRAQVGARAASNERACGGDRAWERRVTDAWAERSSAQAAAIGHACGGIEQRGRMGAGIERGSGGNERTNHRARNGAGIERAGGGNGS